MGQARLVEGVGGVDDPFLDLGAGLAGVVQSAFVVGAVGQ